MAVNANVKAQKVQKEQKPFPIGPTPQLKTTKEMSTLEMSKYFKPSNESTTKPVTI